MRKFKACKPGDHTWNMGGQCVRCGANRAEQTASINMDKFIEFPSEFMSDLKLFQDHGFIMGRMISGSKSGYMEQHPENKVIFNANIVIPSRGKIWYGDIDLSLDAVELMSVAKHLGEPMYILIEMDARFENENQSLKYYQKKAVAIIDHISVIWQ
jgi:hypothetical protein